MVDLIGCYVGVGNRESISLKFCTCPPPPEENACYFILISSTPPGCSQPTCLPFQIPLLPSAYIRVYIFPFWKPTTKPLSCFFFVSQVNLAFEAHFTNHTSFPRASSWFRGPAAITGCLVHKKKTWTVAVPLIFNDVAPCILELHPPMHQ